MEDQRRDFRMNEFVRLKLGPGSIARMLLADAEMNGGMRTDLGV